jgi:hypothetical protein
MPTWKGAPIMAGIPEVSDFVSGAASSSAILGLWVRWLIVRNDKQDVLLEGERRRLNDLSEKAIEAIVLNKAFLESHQSEISELGEVLATETTRILKVLEELSDAIKKT